MNTRKARDEKPPVTAIRETRRLSVTVDDAAIIRAAVAVAAGNNIDVSDWTVESVVTGDNGLLTVTFSTETVSQDAPSA